MKEVNFTLKEVYNYWMIIYKYIEYIYYKYTYKTLRDCYYKLKNWKNSKINVILT